MGHKILIGLREMMVAEKAAICRQWRRMRRRQHKMPASVNTRALAYCVCPPEHKHNIIFLPCKSRDRRIGKSFPPNPGMRFRLMLSYRQRRVKKKPPCLAQRERSPSEGIGAPVSEHTSLKIFTSEGGISTPGATEKQSPLA